VVVGNDTPSQEDAGRGVEEKTAMSFGFGVISWTELLDELDGAGVLPLFRQRVEELGWTLPAGQPLNWDALRAEERPLTRLDPRPTPERGITFSGPGRAFSAMYEAALDMIWGTDGYNDRWTTDRVFLSLIVPEGGEHLFQLESVSASGSTRQWTIQDAESLVWEWEQLAPRWRDRSAEVFARDHDPDPDDEEQQFYWFLGFLPYLGRQSPLVNLPIRL
jgi:hypothetical protein